MTAWSDSSMEPYATLVVWATSTTADAHHRHHSRTTNRRRREREWFMRDPKGDEVNTIIYTYVYIPMWDNSCHIPTFAS